MGLETKGQWNLVQRWQDHCLSLTGRSQPDSRRSYQIFTANCSVKRSTAWAQLESDIFGLCAREKGYDSIQFEPQQGQKPLGTFGVAGLTEMVLVNIDGHDSCGVADARATPLRAGWMASQKCECENIDIADSCGLMPRAAFPMNIIGSTPRLCKAQEGAFWNRWKACDPRSCKQTSCGLQKHAVKKMVKASVHVSGEGNYVTV